jgi:tetratricopeptide (TPR) repeat protein
MSRYRLANFASRGFWLGIFLSCVLLGCVRDPAKLKAQAMAKADRFMELGQTNNAIIEYKNALKADPSSEAAHLRLGQAYAKNSQYREAFQQFEQVLAVSPNNPEAQLAMGHIYLEAGMFEDARQMADNVLAHAPRRVDARLLMANIDASRGMMSLAILELEALAREQPNQAGIHINLGLLYAAANVSDRAASELQRALSLEPTSFDARKALAAIYLSTGRAGEAEQLYRAAVKDAPNSPDSLLTLAQFLDLQHRGAEAEQLYKDSVRVANNSVQSRFALASFYVKQQRFDDARKVDEQIILDDQDFYQARLQLVELALNEGDLNRAVSTLAVLLRGHKPNAEVQIVQARVLMAERKPQQAAELLEASLRQGNSATTHYLLGAAFSQIGNLQRAESEMQAAISADARFVDAYVALAQMMLDRGQPKVSLQYSRMALQRDPDRIDLLLLIGSAYASLGDSDNAEKNFQAYVTAMPHSSEALNRLGLLRVFQKRNADAIAYFERALQLDPKDYEALDGIVSTLILNGEQEKAVARIRTELARQDSSEVLNIAGKAFADVGDWKSAEELLQKAIDKSPDNFASYVLLGSVYARRNKGPEAIRSYESALKMRHNDVGLLTMLGMLYQGQGNVKRAQELYGRALDLDPNSGVAANNLAWIYADSVGDMDKALELARRAKLALPKVANITDTLGWIYARRQLDGMAIPLLREAVKSDPKSAEYRFHLAVALQHSGRKNEARQELSSALKLNAELRQRNEAMELLRVH